MTNNQVYILVTIIILVVIAALLFVVGKHTKQNKLTPIAAAAFGVITAGIFFSDNRSLGYSLIFIGIIIAVIDIIKKSRK